MRTPDAWSRLREALQETEALVWACVVAADGAVREVSGVFVALGVAGSTALARKLGAAVEGSRIVVDDKMQTTVPGLYAALTVFAAASTTSRAIG